MKRRADALLGAFGVAFGLGSLAYPFGRDQGLYYYVAREWVLRGAVPYRDVFDHKTPGIYMLYGAAVRLFGEGMWGIRLLDLLGVVATGLAAGSLTGARGERVADGRYGAGILAASIAYFGYFDFWSTAQSELWFGLFGLASVACAVRRGPASAGLFAGAAILMKPPAVFFVLLAAVLLLSRERRVRAAVVFGAAAGALPLVVLGYLLAKGALPAMIDIVVHANAYYVAHEHGTAGEGPLYFWYVFPFGPALIAIAIAGAVRIGGPWRIALACLGCAAAAVAMQGKYYFLHWAVVVPAYATIAANAYAVRRRVFVPLLCALYLASPAKLPVMERRPAAMWASSAWNAARYLVGRESRGSLLGHFTAAGGGFYFADVLRTGDWLREHTRPGEHVTVRGFEPEVYAVAQRSHEGRFFWTTFLTSPDRAYHRAEWLAEDAAALREHPPKYVVALTNVTAGPDSPASFPAYRPAVIYGPFTILAR